MTWKIYKEQVLDHLVKRLDEGQYSNANHPYLESRFVLPLMEIFPHGGGICRRIPTRR